MSSPILQFLTLDDPLHDDVVRSLIEYKEEDPCIDYKLELDPNSEREWLEVTKDISAFANTLGGYLIFGIKNGDKSIVGLNDELSQLLSDANNILQKINRHLDPGMETIRSREYVAEGKKIVALHIPQSVGKTHLIAKDGIFKHPSGKSKTLLQKGTFYVRRSAGNHLGDSRDLDSVLERRIDQFRESLMEKVARVVKAPQSSEVFILTKDPSDKEAKRFIIEDSPTSIPIKGMSFSVPPEGLEEEVAAWSVLAKSDVNTIPSELTLWKWYDKRTTINIPDEHKMAVFVFSLWRGLPSLYWIRELKSQAIQGALIDAIKRRPTGCDATYLLNVSAFLGKGFYKRAIGALGTYVDRINPRQKKYPDNGPRKEFCVFSPHLKQTEADMRIEKEHELNEIASTVVKTEKLPGLQTKWSAQKIDCLLYARDDRYE